MHEKSNGHYNFLGQNWSKGHATKERFCLLNGANFYLIFDEDGRMKAVNDSQGGGCDQSDHACSDTLEI